MILLTRNLKEPKIVKQLHAVLIQKDNLIEQTKHAKIFRYKFNLKKQYYGHVRQNMYNDYLLSANKKDMMKAIEEMISGKMSLVLVGPNLERIPKFSELEKIFESC